MTSLYIRLRQQGQILDTLPEIGVFARIMKLMVKFYKKRRKIKWRWQSIDSKSVPAPLGGSETGKKPTDRGKQGAKLHLLVDQRGMPLALHITGDGAEACARL